MVRHATSRRGADLQPVDRPGGVPLMHKNRRLSAVAARPSSRAVNQQNVVITGSPNMRHKPVMRTGMRRLMYSSTRSQAPAWELTRPKLQRPPCPLSLALPMVTWHRRLRSEVRSLRRLLPDRYNQISVRTESEPRWQVFSTDHVSNQVSSRYSAAARSCARFRSKPGNAAGL